MKIANVHKSYKNGSADKDGIHLTKETLHQITSLFNTDTVQPFSQRSVYYIRFAFIVVDKQW